MVGRPRAPANLLAAIDWRWVFWVNVTLASGLRQHGVASGVAHQIAALPPVSSLFAAVLGVNPLGHLLAARGGLAGLPAAARHAWLAAHLAALRAARLSLKDLP